jgi:tetratricopeptide (TPR) repeat protein
MASSALTQIHESLSQANSEFEKIWERVFSLADMVGTPEDSGAACRRLLSYNPSNQIVPRSLPNFRKAIESLCQIVSARGAQLQTDPRNPEHYIVLGHCYLAMNDFPNAFGCYSHVSRLGSPIDSPYFHYAFGAVLHHFKYDRDAKEHLQEAFRLGSSHFPAKSDLKLRLAFVQRALGEYDSAVGSLESVIQYVPPAKLTADDINLQIAYTHQLGNRTDKASHVYADLCRRHATTLELVQQYCWFLSLQYDRSSFEKAERVIQQSGHATDPVLRLVMARIAMKQQDMTLAYQRYCDCIAFWTDSPLFWCGLGVLYFKNDQMQDAIVAFQRALYLKPELTEAWANLGLIFELQRETATAITVYQQALQTCSEKDVKPIRERLNGLNGGRQRQVTNSQIMDVNDSPFFIQVAERLASEFAGNSPVIPAALIGGDDALEAGLTEMALPHKSIF